MSTRPRIEVSGQIEQYHYIRGHAVELGITYRLLMRSSASALSAWLADRIDLVGPNGRPVLLNLSVARRVLQNPELRDELRRIMQDDLQRQGAA